MFGEKTPFLAVYIQGSIHYLQLGYYAKLGAPGLFNSLACSMAWRKFQGWPLKPGDFPTSLRSQGPQKGGVMTPKPRWWRSWLLWPKGTDTLHTKKIGFFSLLWLSKNWRRWFKTLPEAFGTSGKRMRIKQIWALHFANAQDKFVTLLHRRSGSTLATCMKRWLVRSPCLLSSELCLDLNGLLANGPWQLDHGETPTWNLHISQVVVKLTDPEPATLWVAGANIPNLQRTRECWTRPGPGQRPSCLMTDLSSSPCLRIKGGDTLHRMKS